MRTLAAALVSALLAIAAPTSPNPRAVALEQPFGKTNAFVSPDGRHSLWGDYQNSELELEDNATHTARPVANMTVQTLSVAWAPDGRSFAVNDRPTSSAEHAFLYDTATLERVDLRDRLTAARPEAARFDLTTARAGMLSHGRMPLHSYLHVLRWMDDRHVELQLHGNTDGRFAHDNPDSHLYPARCFDLRYRVGLDGSVQKISSRVFKAKAALNDHACGFGFD